MWQSIYKRWPLQFIFAERKHEQSLLHKKEWGSSSIWSGSSPVVSRKSRDSYVFLSGHKREGGKKEKRRPIILYWNHSGCLECGSSLKKKKKKSIFFSLWLFFFFDIEKCLVWAKFHAKCFMSVVLSNPRWMHCMNNYFVQPSSGTPNARTLKHFVII